MILHLLYFFELQLWQADIFWSHFVHFMLHDGWNCSSTSHLIQELSWDLASWMGHLLDFLILAWVSILLVFIRLGFATYLKVSFQIIKISQFFLLNNRRFFCFCPFKNNRLTFTVSCIVISWADLKLNSFISHPSPKAMLLEIWQEYQIKFNVQVQWCSFLEYHRVIVDYPIHSRDWIKVLLQAQDLSRELENPSNLEPTPTSVDPYILK